MRWDVQLVYELADGIIAVASHKVETIYTGLQASRPGSIARLHARLLGRRSGFGPSQITQRGRGIGNVPKRPSASRL